MYHQPQASQCYWEMNFRNLIILSTKWLSCIHKQQKFHFVHITPMLFLSTNQHETIILITNFHNITNIHITQIVHFTFGPHVRVGYYDSESVLILHISFLLFSLQFCYCFCWKSQVVFLVKFPTICICFPIWWLHIIFSGCIS